MLWCIFLWLGTSSTGQELLSVVRKSGFLHCCGKRQLILVSHQTWTWSSLCFKSKGVTRKDLCCSLSTQLRLPDGAEISLYWRKDFPGICGDAGAERSSRYWAVVGLRMCWSTIRETTFTKIWLLSSAPGDLCCQTSVKLYLFHLKLKPNPKAGCYSHSTLPGFPVKNVPKLQNWDVSLQNFYKPLKFLHRL